MPFRRVKQGVPIPEASRWDRMSSENLYLALESALATATHLTDQYRHDPASREKNLALLETEVQTALQSCQALRRKYLNVAD